MSMSFKIQVYEFSQFLLSLLYAVLSLSLSFQTQPRIDLIKYGTGFADNILSKLNLENLEFQHATCDIMHDLFVDRIVLKTNLHV